MKSRIWLLSLFFVSATCLTCKPTGKVEDFCCELETLDSVNSAVYPLLQKLRNTTYFRIFKVNLSADCPFWAQKNMCQNAGCSVCECSEEQIPIAWRKQEMTDQVDRRVTPKFARWSVQDDNLLVRHLRWDQEDSNQWIAEEDTSSSVYVDLKANPEGHTGYAGASTKQIWSAIYKENCFSGSFHDMCSEERAFYRVISGLHASISSHISERYTAPDGGFEPNLDVYKERVGNHPDRLENMFFVYSMMLRALTRISPELESFTFETGNAEEDLVVGETVKELLKVTKEKCASTFDETKMFKSSPPRMKQQFRSHFRNISLIMDCVTCEKCRLHGKMQIAGLGFALKVLFSDPAEKLEIGRNELIAYMNTLGKFAHAVAVIDLMRQREVKRLVITCVAVVGSLLAACLIFLWVVRRCRSPKKGTAGGERRVSKKDE